MEGIKQLTFEEIKYFWKKYLWSKYTTPIKRIDIHTQKDYFYKYTQSLTQEQIEFLIPVTYIGYKSDEIIGVESGYRTNFNYYRVRGLWVHEHHRNKGIATKLIKYFENTCNTKYLWTCPRETALPFYEKYGFRVKGLSEKTIYGQNYFAVKRVK